VTHRLSKPAEKVYPEAVQDVRGCGAVREGRGCELKGRSGAHRSHGRFLGRAPRGAGPLAGEHALFRKATPPDPARPHLDRRQGLRTGLRVLYLARQMRHDQISRPRDQIVEKFLGASLIDDRRIYFRPSPLSHVSSKNNGTAFLLAWGTEDDVVDHKEQSEAFLEALKQAGHYVRSVVVAGAPHFWIGDPIDEPGSHSGFFAQRLLPVSDRRGFDARPRGTASSRARLRAFLCAQTYPSRGRSGSWSRSRRARLGPRRARGRAEALGGLRQPVVVENRVGANGSVGAEAVARSAPDGYTLVMGSNANITTNPHLMALSYDPMKDLAPVAMLTVNLCGSVLCVQGLSSAALRADPGATDSMLPVCIRNDVQ